MLMKPKRRWHVLRLFFIVAGLNFEMSLFNELCQK